MKENSRDGRAPANSCEGRPIRELGRARLGRHRVLTGTFVFPAGALRRHFAIRKLLENRRRDAGSTTSREGVCRRRHSLYGRYTPLTHGSPKAPFCACTTMSSPL